VDVIQYFFCLKKVHFFCLIDLRFFCEIGLPHLLRQLSGQERCSGHLGDTATVDSMDKTPGGRLRGQVPETFSKNQPLFFLFY